MPKKNEGLSSRRRLFSQTIIRSLVLSFLLISLVPVGLLGFKVYQAAWEGVWREIYEKHRLLAMNLASPIGIYVKDHRTMIELLAKQLVPLNKAAQRNHNTQLLNSTVRYLTDFRSLTLMDLEGNILTHASAPEMRLSQPDKEDFANEACFLKTRGKGIWCLSGIQPSPVDGQPTIIMGQPVKTVSDNMVAVLLGELRIDVIETLRRNIKFGKKGHSAIVDQTGHVIAHPNPQWMKEMRDLSKISVVKKMMAGQTGVAEFYSPFIKANMVAGYTSIPDIGWGVMVPQPKPEIEEQVRKLLYTQLWWGLLGVLLAAVLGLILARWITRPINRLADSAHDLMRNRFKGEIPQVPTNAPYEVRQLGHALKVVIDGLQKSRLEVEGLNKNLQDRVAIATQQLRQANRQLTQLAHQDHLTSLANRRSFEETLAGGLRRRESDISPMCILLIDIDYFKKINDEFGHGAGDMVLIQVAGILEKAMRQSDIVSRYGGDEFAACMYCDIDVGLQRAQKLLETIRHTDFVWQNTTIPLTVSIGIFHSDTLHDMDMESVLHKVDSAMYDAKRKGRDCVVDITL